MNNFDYFFSPLRESSFSLFSMSVGVFIIFLVFMARVEDINDRMATMRIEDEENEGLCFGDEAEEVSNKFELCLVGRFLTEKNLNIRAMKSKLADIWRPVRGINIKDLKPGIFLFQFYHIDDMQ